MHLTDKSRLILLIEFFADASKSKERRRRAGLEMGRRFPPKRRTALYANTLRDARLSDGGRWIVMLMLYYVGNEHAIRGFTAFYDDPEMPDALKLDALVFALSLQPGLRFTPSPLAPRFPLSWLMSGLRKLPPLPVEERRAFVLDRLMVDLLEERKSQ